MTRRARMVAGILILVVSIALLIWAYRPLDRVTRMQPIPPADLQLPTPSSLLIQSVIVS